MYDSRVSSHDRELWRARTAFVAAARELQDALTEWDAAGVPLDPAGLMGGPVREWTRDDVRVTVRVTRAFRELVETRRAWDQLRREFKPSH